MIATNHNLEEMPIVLRVHKAEQNPKKAVYIRSTDTIYAFCPVRNTYVKDNAAFTFHSARQWGLDATNRTEQKQISVKRLVYALGQSIAWHESKGGDVLLYYSS